MTDWQAYGISVLERFQKQFALPGPLEWLRSLAIATLPLLLIAGAAMLPPLPEIDADALQPPDRTGLEAARAEAQARLLEPQPDAAERYSELSTHQLSQALTALGQYAATEEAGRTRGTVGLFKRYIGSLAFLLAALLLTIVTAVMIYAQVALLRHYAGEFWPRLKPNSLARVDDRESFDKAAESRPMLLAWLWFLIGFLLGVGLALRFDLIVPWLPDVSSNLPGWHDAFWEPAESMGRFVADPAAGLGLLIGLVFCFTAVTAWGARLIARSYPLAKTAIELERGLEDAQRLRKPDETPDPGAPPDPLDDRATFLNALWQARSEKTGLAPVNRGLPATAKMELIKTLARPLVVIYILVLLVLYLGFELAEARLQVPEPILTQVSASNDMVLLAAGVFLSLTYAAIFVPAIARLDPHVGAEAYLKSSGGAGGSAPDWVIESGAGDNSEQILVSKKQGKKKTKLNKDLEAFLGASLSKLNIIIERANYGGGVHSVLQQDIKEQLKTIGALLAPAFSGSILALLG